MVISGIESCQARHWAVCVICASLSLLKYLEKPSTNHRNTVDKKVAINRFDYRPLNSSGDCCLSRNSIYTTMAYSVPPRINPLKELTDWFLGVYNAPVYAPAVPLRGGSVEKDGTASSPLSLLAFPLPLKGVLFCFLAIFVVSYARGSRQRLPPQPRPLPIFGNFFQLTNRRWLYSRDCKERFSEYRD